MVVTATDAEAQTGQGTATPVGPVSAPAPPVNTTLPAISGTPTHGSTLTASPGTWTSPDKLAYDYRWQRCDSTGANCVPITGALGKTYKLTNADIGHQITVIVTATDLEHQTGLATANPVGPVN